MVEEALFEVSSYINIGISFFCPHASMYDAQGNFLNCRELYDKLITIRSVGRFPTCVGGVVRIACRSVRGARNQ